MSHREPSSTGLAQMVQVESQDLSALGNRAALAMCGADTSYRSFQAACQTILDGLHDDVEQVRLYLLDPVDRMLHEEAVVDRVNALLRDTRANPWLTRHPEMPEWHLHLAADRDPLAQRMGAEMAMALADLIRAGELRRLKTCAASDCTAVLIDMSRNRSRIFCDTGNCGNRQHVAAYRERRAREN